MAAVVVKKGGARRKSDADIKAIVESCGWVFNGREQGRTPAGKSICNINVTCPYGHQCDMAWDNFKPKDGEVKPKKGCGPCCDNDFGARSRKNIAPWSEQTGVRLLGGAYNHDREIRTWICANGHEFTSSFQDLERKKRDLCIRCVDETFAARHNVRYANPWAFYTSRTAVSWVCVECEETFVATKEQLTNGTRTCPNC